MITEYTYRLKLIRYSQSYVSALTRVFPLIWKSFTAGQSESLIIPLFRMREIDGGSGTQGSVVIFALIFELSKYKRREVTGRLNHHLIGILLI